jgi:isopenicillin-N N-acyltransferase-like protein
LKRTLEKSTDLPFDLASRLLRLDGKPRLRGRIHGETCRTMIHEGIRKWKEALGDATGSAPDRYLADFLSFTNFLPAIRVWTPDLLEEVCGIAEGCAVDFNTILAYQLIDEEWWYRSVIHSGASPTAGTGCSALGVKTSEVHPAFLAQNMDLVSTMDGGQMLIHVSQDRLPEAFVFTLAGMIALNGMNSCAIGICCNQLVQLESAQTGLPVAFIIRKVLQQPDFNRAVQVINMIPHASGQNYLIGSPRNLADFECSANKTVQYKPVDGVNWICHTNHPLANVDTSTFDQMERVYTAEVRQALDTDTTGRFAFLKNKLEQHSEVIRSEWIKSVLSSQETPVCKVIPAGNDPQTIGAFTFGCLVMTLTSNPVLEISFGPPSVRPFYQLVFKNGCYPGEKIQS